MSTTPDASSRGLRLGRHRLSDLRLGTLVVRAIGYGLACVALLYIGAVAMGRTRGFAYLVANEFGSHFGESLTADRASLSPSLSHLAVQDLRTITNRNQKVVYTRIDKLEVRLEALRPVGIEVTGLSVDVVFQPDGACTPAGLGFIAHWPLFNRIEALAKRRSGDRAKAARAGEPAPTPDADAEESDLRRHAVDWAHLPSLRLIDGSLRVKGARGELLAELDDIDAEWTPAGRGTNDAARIALHAGYRIPQRGVPRRILDVVMHLRNGHVDVERLEAETALLMEMGRYLDGLEKPEATPSAEAAREERPLGDVNPADPADRVPDP